ncbi:MAG: type I restriction endonuclease subunit R [Thermoleophilia bacterium]
MSDYSEDALVEKPAIALFAELGWETAGCYNEIFSASGEGATPERPGLGRETTAEVVLIPRLRQALEKLNPDLPTEAISDAIEQLTRDRSAMSPAVANREIYKLLKDGVKVATGDRAGTGEEQVETARVIDWDNSENNNFLLTSQLWISGDMYKRRADLVGFVNGLPLLFIELKASHRRLENAFRDNLRDYKNAIPQLFWYNDLVILSNGSQSRIGSMTSEWGHFNEWKKINSEGEAGVVSLETMIRGTCEKDRFLDLVENFTVFSDIRGGLIKMVAKNHQFLGVNNAIEAMSDARDRQGRLGVFWHTQGSGKSLSMVFFSQKVLRKLPGNYTFLIVTDRTDLDDQIYKYFASAGSVTEGEIQAASGEHLKQLLREDHRFIFTLIQKFRTEKGATFPTLSERDDIIVITDEAHRSQYDTFALNMRNALPYASFIGFTGTPLMVGEEKTREVFGDYVSVYNFKQSMDDGATVPLYYENRIPELQLTNDELNEDMERLLEDAELSEDQEKKLEREFAREYHLITRDDRLEKVAEDIVGHFMGRGFAGKAMVVAIDKATAVRMYDKVQKYWREYLEKLKSDFAESDFAGREAERDDLAARIIYMEETDMAVVVSQAQNEIEDFRQMGLDIAPHRRRMVSEDLDTKFKDPNNPFRIVFVCAMWMTGFDVPSCSTIYLDKPMRNHTLMQTIARANRVFGEKVNGLIVDYVGIFRSLQRALAIYGTGEGGAAGEGDWPVQDKSALVAELGKAIEEAQKFCAELHIDTKALSAADGFDFIKLRDDAADIIVAREESKKRFLSLADNVNRLFRAILPDRAANEFGPARALFSVIAEKIRSDAPEVDVSEVVDSVDRLLDDSIAVEGYVISASDNAIDLSKIDFDTLRSRFEKGHRHLETERLKTALTVKIKKMAAFNHSRMDFLTKLQEMIDEYNSGACNVEELFDRLLKLTGELSREDQRAVSEQLSEEELAIFDLLTRPQIELSEKERKRVKKAARDLLATLKNEKLVLDWRKRQQARAAVRVTISEMLDGELPAAYSEKLYQQKCDLLYPHVYDSYFGQGRSIYSSAA